MLEATAILTTALVFVTMALGHFSARFAGDRLWPHLLPFAATVLAIGVVVALLLTKGTLNLMSFIGIIMLMGLVTKNGILLVEFTNQLRAAGRSTRDALLEAGPIRLRPILMTSAATIFGHLPLILNPDGTKMSKRKSQPAVADYIAGMTDRFAAREHERLTGRRLLP